MSTKFSKPQLPCLSPNWSLPKYSSAIVSWCYFVTLLVSLFEISLFLNIFCANMSNVAHYYLTIQVFWMIGTKFVLTFNLFQFWMLNNYLMDSVWTSTCVIMEVWQELNASCVGLTQAKEESLQPACMPTAYMCMGCCSGHFQFWIHFRFYRNIAGRGTPPQSWPMCPNKGRAFWLHFSYNFGNSVLTLWYWDSLLDFV